ncbi:MAG: hypothetical protein R3F61_23590 [Myxococcota bacterium]
MLLSGLAMAGGGGSMPRSACETDREVVASCMSDAALAVDSAEPVDPARRVERVAVVVWRAVTRQNPWVEQECRAIGQVRAEVHVFHDARPLYSEGSGWFPGGFSSSSPVSVPFAPDGAVVLESMSAKQWEHPVFPLRDVTLSLPPGASRVRLQGTLSAREDGAPGATARWIEYPIDQELACDWREHRESRAPAGG